jgi:hypothetical protein
MKTKLIIATCLATVVGLFAAGAASAAFVAIYRNAMETTTQRSEIRKLSGKSCTRGGGKTSLNVTVGKLTEECAFKTPVVGSDLEIAVTGRIVAPTTPAVAKKSFLGLVMRAGGGSKLELRVFPSQKKVQIARITKEGIKYLAIKKNVTAIQAPEKANVIRLRVISSSGEEANACKIGGYIGSELAVETSDPACSELAGEATAVTAGAPNNGSGLTAAFEAIVVRTPVRF